jgi:hypothetical protein
MTDHCEHWRGLVAMAVVGQIEAEDRVALAAHLDGCAECRQAARELEPLGALLGSADPTTADEAVLSPALEAAVLERLRAEARRARRQRLTRRTLAAAAAVVVAVGGVVAGLALSAPAPGRTLVLGGPAGVTARATLTPEPWGTQVTLSASGQPPGQVFTVAMRTAQGRWWEAGSYRTVAGRDVVVRLACAVPTGQIAALYVEDGQGRTVLRTATGA